ncbi:Protein-tyrosine phosphatase-like [Trinorchestia longiramus]|nr:Protein-tyrosine phosphatase-like [Trinorchestia longiramus]
MYLQEGYKFVYEALEEYLTCAQSYFPVTELSQRLKHKSTKGPNGKNEYQMEFETICKMTPRFTIGDCAGGHRADNRFKNRNVLCVPPDNFRPYLTSFQGNACTDYINSVFVDVSACAGASNVVCAASAVAGPTCVILPGDARGTTSGTAADNEDDAAANNSSFTELVVPTLLCC